MGSYSQLDLDISLCTKYRLLCNAGDSLISLLPHPMTATVTAQEAFRAAYENRYTWDENFPGYRAHLTVTQGDERYEGEVEVKADYTVTVTGFSDETVQESVYNQMRDIVTHRKQGNFEKSHGKNEFSFGETDASGAIAIDVKGDAMGSNYKIRGTEICQVSRVMGPVAFTINTEESLDTGSGYIAIKYNAIFKDPKTDTLKGKRDFTETYGELGGYYLPTQQTVEAIAAGGEKIFTDFSFTNLELLA
ncbi:slr1900 [Synechocystis sp. PCC 6803]|uniref:Slr1900 protein n=2 Tax=Synechocystis TaxID=1142 RepID=P73328_SYNY3|nr:hypothetical protein MYO_17890 [Synechocystis sp. PCC 6803]AVP88928.1 DUF3386 domain-containing protein [Synechocystis sp. IPPAS B-1465]BAL28531.1 hypothetical protein SYNGTI_0784 [Synechocystis sp. PCC 6803 substr. GT-I]BAL31700.1 hypothetical protein SYNPCCN_0783 [Synechocystis sp. PCC 6803 substr. PCC-N]BAL34869.1 hypothetical protein SYNPCCP_0783 [Synechocystis sp. PCC 6803 substr. PCC-P]